MKDSLSKFVKFVVANDGKPLGDYYLEIQVRDYHLYISFIDENLTLLSISGEDIDELDEFKVDDKIYYNVPIEKLIEVLPDGVIWAENKVMG